MMGLAIALSIKAIINKGQQPLPFVYYQPVNTD